MPIFQSLGREVTAKSGAKVLYSEVMHTFVNLRYMIARGTPTVRNIDLLNGFMMCPANIQEGFNKYLQLTFWEYF